MSASREDWFSTLFFMCLLLQLSLMIQFGERIIPSPNTNLMCPRNLPKSPIWRDVSRGAADRSLIPPHSLPILWGSQLFQDRGDGSLGSAFLASQCPADCQLGSNVTLLWRGQPSPSPCSAWNAGLEGEGQAIAKLYLIWARRAQLHNSSTPLPLRNRRALQALTAGTNIIIDLKAADLNMQ